MENNNINELFSIKGFKVKKKEYDKKIYLQYICAKEDKITAELFASNNVKYNKKNDYLDPKLKNLLPKIGVLKDTDKAVNRILKAIENKEKICIFGDYDVDGTTSTAMLILFFQQLNIDVNYYIPDRIKEGYGPNVNAIDTIAQNQVNLIICVDCGTTAYEPLKKAKELGIDVVVIDHHKSDEILPECISCINPNRLDETEIDKDLHCLCACGVSFLVLIALSSELKKQNIIIDLLQFTPLVAFATICDVMNLTTLNRAFVKTGIKILKNNKSFNLYELINIVEIERQKKNLKNKSIELTSYCFGFLLGPMVNAGGRVGNSSLGVELLIEKNKQTASVIAEQLYNLNEERKEIESEILNGLVEKKQEIQEQIANQGFILLYSKDWHEGVIGLIASRIKERYFYPVFIGTETPNNTIKFSARSINGIDVGNIILEAIEKKILLNGGGHKMAGGMTCDINKIEEFKQFLKDKIKISAENIFEEKETYYNIVLSLSGLSFNLLDKVAKFEPFGVGNEKPIFLIQDSIVLQIDVIKEKHISLIIKDENVSEKTICFNCIDTELGKFLLSSKGKKISLLVSANIDQWNGNIKKNIIIEDAIK